MGSCSRTKGPAASCRSCGVILHPLPRMRWAPNVVANVNVVMLVMKGGFFMQKNDNLMGNMEKKTGLPVQMIVILAFLTALDIILERFLSISVWNMRIGFAFLPIAIAGVLYGPVPAALVGAAGDILGMLLFPSGPYFPGFTLTAALTGAVFGIFLYNKLTVKRIIGAVAVNQLVLSLFVQTLWISITYGAPYAGLLPVRLTQCLVMIPVQMVTLQFLGKPVLAAARTAGL